MTNLRQIINLNDSNFFVHNNLLHLHSKRISMQQLFHEANFNFNFNLKSNLFDIIKDNIVVYQQCMTYA